MDPALEELCEQGTEQDEVSVILRLKDGAKAPSDVRVIAEFGKPGPKIVTARCMRRDIRRIHDSEEIASMKAARPVVGAVPFEEYDGDAESELWLDSTLTSSDDNPFSVPENGAGVVVGVCDWGFDFTHENFRNEDGTTRLLALWDQGAESGESPMPYGYGRVYTREEINNALATPDPTESLGYHPSGGDPRATGAHGTHVADILAGNRRAPGSEVGLASASDIVFVHLATERMRELENFGDSVRLLEGLDFVRRQAGENPLVSHWSAGRTGGPKDGSALFAQAVDAFVLERDGLVVAQSVGNYASTRMHTHGRIGPDQEHVLHWLISSRDRTPNELEVWYSGEDHFDLVLVAPNGARFPAALGENVKLVQNGTHWGTLYHRRRDPNNKMNHIDIFLKTESLAGRYRVELRGRDIVDGRFQAWIERDSGGRNQSRFPRRQATSQYTTNTICNSYRGVAVGAYDATAEDRPPTLFTSRGPTSDGRQKPELVAPGYRIRAARSVPAGGWKGESRLTVKSGTSMAAPWVSGTVALMMQAAGRPMSITEVRRVLIGTADPPPSRRGRSSTRLGYGYLNTVAAVEAARRLGRSGSAAEDLGSAHDALGGFSAEWAPRWIVDPQPFEDDAEHPMVAMSTKELSNPKADLEDWTTTIGDEGDAEPDEAADLGTMDEDDDGPISADLSRREEEENEGDRMTELYDALGELAEMDQRDPIIRRGEDVPGRGQVLDEQQNAELITRCGFFGPNARRTTQQVRDAVRNAARAEWRNWHTRAGAPRRENVMAMFGHLVRYYLSTIRQVQPDTLAAIQRTANGPIAYGPIPASGSTNAAINAWARRIRRLLLAGAPNTGVPANLATQVQSAVKRSRQAHFNRGAHRAWSAAWVLACVRGAGIQLGLEAMIQGNHSGRDALILASGRHAEYTLEAHRRRAGPNRRNGTYHAFSPAARAPQTGDIIVQDRHARGQARPLTFARINALARGRLLHGDVVVEVAADHVVALGGNLGGSCRQRRFPLNDNGRLVVERNQLYVQENDAGVLPGLPATTNRRALHTRSTQRIFALLSPVEACAAAPGQPYRGGILT